MTTPAKINFKIYQGATFQQALRWESETKTYVPITNISRSAPVTITVDNPALLPPVGWRARVTNVLGMKEINMPEDDYQIISSINGSVVTFNPINSLAYTAYTSGGVLEYNTPVDLAGYTARMDIRGKVSDTAILLSLTTQNGGILINNVLKTITIIITAAQTAGLNFSQAVYDLELVNSDGVVTRFSEGTIQLRAEVTR